MCLIFDTSVLIDIERENKQTLAKIAELRTRYPIPPKIAFISYYEFIHGIRKRNPQNKAKAEDFIRLFEIVNTTEETAKRLSQLKEKHELALADLLIAAQVWEKQAILVTKDTDFKQINEIDKIIL